MEVEKCPNSNTLVMWMVNFKSEVCSGTSFPAEAMVCINDIDSANNMDELKSSSSLLGRLLPDFEVLVSNKASALKKLLTTNFKRRV